MSRESLRVAGCLCLGAALAVAGWRTYVVTTGQWVPIEIQLPLTAAPVETREFTVDRSGTYEVVIAIARPPEGRNRTLAECLLGFDDGNPHWGQGQRGARCAVAPVIDMTWSVSLPKSGGDARVIREGVASGLASGGGFSVDAVDRHLATLDLTKDTTYALSLATRMDARALRPFRPRLVVQPAGAANENEAVTTLGIWLVAAVAGAFGIGLLGVSLFQR